MYDYSGSLILGWANGYYKDKYKITTATAVEQKLRKEALNNLDSMICGFNVYTLGDDIFLSQDVPDTEWFFILSMFYSFVKGGGLPSHAFFHSSPVWVAGADRLAGLPCDRTRWGQSLGLQTMVCIPWANGVVELGSTELIFHGLHELDLIKQVRDLFKFSSTKMSLWPITEQGESKYCLHRLNVDIDIYNFGNVSFTPCVKVTVSHPH
ncbi:transcription factor MYC1-like [Fagus crenata]